MAIKTKTKWMLISGAVALGGAGLWALTHPLQAILGVAVLGGGAFVANKLKGGEQGEADKAAAAAPSAGETGAVVEGELEPEPVRPATASVSASAARAAAPRADSPEVAAELEALRARVARGER